MMLVGSTVVASKVIAAGLPPFTATALRFAVALPVLLGLMRLTWTAWPKAERRDWMLLLLQAGAGSVGYTTLLISGLRLTSAADAGIILGTLPVVSAAIVMLVLGERPSPSLLAAIGLAAIGVVAIAMQGQGGGSSLAGDGLILAAVVCEGLFILLHKRLRVAISPLALATIMTGLGLVVALGPAISERPWTVGLSPDALIATIYYALVPTVGGFLLWYAGSERVSGAESCLFTALAPVSAVLLAFGLLGEAVGRGHAIGIACVLAAVASLGLIRRRETI